MLSIGNIGGASAAASYYDRDDYYTRDELAPSMWFGQGADAMGLEGIVDKDAFESVLEGYVPGSNDRVGYENDGNWIHRGGFDATFSAPKSVSILAEVGGDTRLVRAHDRAVEIALSKIERDLLQYRVKEAGGHRHERADNMIAAVYRHDLSRDLDPQLHSHAVIANMTQTARGWRSLSTERLFRHSKEVGVAYQQALALEVRGLGYKVEQKANGTFEIPGPASAVAAAFQRRTDAIDAYLRTKGIDPALATAEMRQKAVLATRKSKRDVDRQSVHGDWVARIGEAALEALDQQQAHARQRVLQGEIEISADELSGSADRVLAEAVAILSERAARVSEEAVLAKANELAIGRTTAGHVLEALTKAKETSGIYAVSVREPDPSSRSDVTKSGITTRQAQIAEGRMLAGMRRMQGGDRSIADHRTASDAVGSALRASQRQGHVWTEDQRLAAMGILLEKDRAIGLQGLPGTAKTTTVLKTIAAVAEASGLKVVALAPTASAAKTLGDSLVLNGRTVTSHLDAAERNAPGMGSKGRALWIVDEASMVSARDMGRLLEEADRRAARLVLVGDRGQLPSIGAGAAFGQLQDRGLSTFTLSTIVRQTNPLMKSVADAAANHRGAEAIDLLEKAERVVEEPSMEVRVRTIAETYTLLPAAERAATLIVDPTRSGRDLITAEVRQRLVSQGELGSEKTNLTRLEDKQLTEAERRWAGSYAPGDVVISTRSLRLQGSKLHAGDHATVVSVDRENATVTIVSDKDRMMTWSPNRKGAPSMQVFAAVSADLRVGDQITWTRNDRTRRLANNQSGIVMDIQGSHALIHFGEDKRITINLSERSGQHWRHGYVQTLHAAQGQTTDRVIAHLPERHLHAVNARALNVALTRAREEGVIVTDSKEMLKAGVMARSGAAETALHRHECGSAWNKAPV